MHGMYLRTYVHTYVGNESIGWNGKRLHGLKLVRYIIIIVIYVFHFFVAPSIFYLFLFFYKRWSIKGEYTNWDVQREISIIRKEEDIRDEMLGSLCSNKKESSRNGAEG